MVASGIVDGGIQELSPIALGQVVTFRRNGVSPVTGTSRMFLNELKLYETVNLLEEKYGGRIRLTEDTSISL